MTVFIPGPELLSSPVGRELPAVVAGRRPMTPVPKRCRIVVVGAGPAGITVASHLWHAMGGLDDVVILDDQADPMARFRRRATRLGLPVLRSPYEHHLGAHNGRDCELLDFARCHWGALTSIERQQVRMAMSGQRSVVPWDVFEAYADHVLVSHGITRRHWQTTVRQVTADGHQLRVVHGSGTLSADVVVLALGEEAPALPAGWPDVDQVQRWDAAQPAISGECVAVSGSGLSAAQLLAGVCSAGGRAVWLQRSAERYQCADVNAKYFRPEGRARFLAMGLQDRIAVLRAQRRPSIMFEFRPLLQRWQQEGRLQVVRNRTVVDIDQATDGSLTLRLDDGHRIGGVARVLAAHGTQPARLPLGSRYQRVGGYPRLDDSTLELAGQPGVYVAGAQASLSVGPAARNIDGARIAALRITRALTANGAR
jgi:glycine/D-amino acid oxidase-like deaminating enzyme